MAGAFTGLKLPMPPFAGAGNGLIVEAMRRFTLCFCVKRRDGVKTDDRGAVEIAINPLFQLTLSGYKSGISS